ncbi:transposase [Saccharopolyspora sp. NPDC049357]|uniref:transposase n=1 Tax=Saccharopolyspora sp. NPDC049357 TaxID=3154507 RepID=UPI0034490617
MISVHDTGAAGALGDLSRFRHAFYQCLAARADVLFELTDAALCAEGPVTSLVELSLATEHRRGHGALYDSLNQGRIDIDRFRNVVAVQQLPRCDDGRIVLAIDVSNWLRPDANTSPDRLFCHTYARGSGQAQMIPGWPYSFVAAVEPGRTSWTAVLDVTRVQPDDDHTDCAAAQLRTVVEALITAGHWREGDPEIWIIGDSGYDGPRLAFLLADLPVQVLVRLRSDRVMAFPAPPRRPGTVGRNARHGARFVFKDPRTWPTPRHDHPHHALRHRARPLVGSVAPQADPHRRLGAARRSAPGHGRHSDPATGRPVTRHRYPETVMAVAFRHRDHCHADGPTMADVLTSLRSGTYFPIPQANSRLDHSSRSLASGGRSMDLAGDRGLHPAPVGSSPRGGPPASVGEKDSHTCSVVPSPCPAGFSPRSSDDRIARQRTEILPAWSRAPSRITKLSPSPATRPRQSRKNGHQGLNPKLRSRPPG